jgi:hypothetical protein
MYTPIFMQCSSSPTQDTVCYMETVYCFPIPMTTLDDSKVSMVIYAIACHLRRL